MSNCLIHLGIDDTDRPAGGCTTHLASSLIGIILEEGGIFIDFPNLIRLNPDIPWKTRGNAAVCLRFKVNRSLRENIFEKIIKKLDEYVEVSEKTNPAIVAYEGEIPPKRVRQISRKALFKVVKIKEVEEIIEKSNKFYSYFKGNGRGRVGALAAIGNPLIWEDHTYELLAYRKPENIGKKRDIKKESIFKLLKNPKLFANYDFETDRILITPHGRDPVLFGIRGERPEDVYKALNEIHVSEPIDRWVIFVTNQGTDAHFKHVSRRVKIKAYEQTVIEGAVEEEPVEIEGGHVILKLGKNKEKVTCMAYVEGGKLNKISKRLTKGDRLRIYGGIKVKKEEITLNVQKIEILEENEAVKTRPICFRCGKKMTSLGRRKGYICKCGFHLPHVEVIIHRRRDIRPKILLPPYRSIRHLTKPIKRYGRENFRRKMDITFTPWCSFLLKQHLY